MKCNIFIAERRSLDFLYCYIRLFANKLFAPLSLCTVSRVAAATAAGLSCCCPAVLWADGVVKLCELTARSCDCAEGLAACWEPGRRMGSCAVPGQGLAAGGPEGKPQCSPLSELCRSGLACPSFPFFIKK